MILSQRYPAAFNGIVSGDPAMRTGLSNLAIGKWIPVAYNQAAPKDSSGKPQLDKFLSDSQRKLFMSALMDRCDAKDGVADGMISDPLGCDFDPAVLSCKAGQGDACIAPEKVAAIKKAFRRGQRTRTAPRSTRAFSMTPVSRKRARFRGLLSLGTKVASSAHIRRRPRSMSTRRLCMPRIPLVEPALRRTCIDIFRGWRQESSSSMETVIPGSRLLDTLNYYQSLAAASDGAKKVSEWSRMFLVPGMRHCGGGPALDQFDMLSAVVKWVEKGDAISRSSLLQEKHFLAEADRCVHIPNMLSTRGTGTRTTPLILAISDIRFSPLRCARVEHRASDAAQA